MKSKLFLSLSFLTAVVSMNAAENTLSNQFRVAGRFNGQTVYSPLMSNPDVLTGGSFISNSYFAKSIAKAFTPAAVIVGGGLLAQSYMQPKVEVKAPTYIERAKAQVQSGYNFAKINAIKGYNLALEHKGKTAGAVAVVAALGYVAYKNSDAIFGNSKKTVTAPVVKATPVRMHSKPFSRG